MPIRVPIDLGDEFASELYIMGVDIKTIDQVYREAFGYLATLTEKEKRERARQLSRIRKTGKIS